MSASAIAHGYPCFWCFSLINGGTIIVSANVSFSIAGFSWFTFKPMDEQPSFKGKEFMWSEEASFFFLVIHHQPYLGAMEFCSLFSSFSHENHCSQIFLTAVLSLWTGLSESVVPETGEKRVYLLCRREHMFLPPLLKLLKGPCFLRLDRLNWIYFISKDSSSSSL